MSIMMLIMSLTACFSGLHSLMEFFLPIKRRSFPEEKMKGRESDSGSILLLCERSRLVHAVLAHVVRVPAVAPLNAGPHVKEHVVALNAGPDVKKHHASSHWDISCSLISLGKKTSFPFLNIY